MRPSDVRSTRYTGNADNPRVSFPFHAEHTGSSSVLCMERSQMAKKHRRKAKARQGHQSSPEGKLVKTAAWSAYLKEMEGRSSVKLGEMQDYYRAA